MPRFVLRRKSDGKFYSKRQGWNRDRVWVDDLDKAWIYKQRGGPRNSMHGLGLIGVNVYGRKAQELRARERFDKDFEVLEVVITLKKVN